MKWLGAIPGIIFVFRRTAPTTVSSDSKRRNGRQGEEAKLFEQQIHPSVRRAGCGALRRGL